MVLALYASQTAIRLFDSAMTLLNDLENATLTLVTGVGHPGDYDRDPTVGATKFTGEERVFWKESADRVPIGTTITDVIIARSMLVDPSVSVAWAQGDTVTVTRDGGSSQTAKVKKHTTSGTDETGRVTRVIFEDG